METTIRLLTPDKKGIGKRLAEAVAAAGGIVQQTRVARRMRGMNETEMRISFPDETILTGVVQSLGQLPGVAILTAEKS